MNVRFIAPDPRERARPLLDRVLGAGTDQIAIACAFLTPGGVELLKRHAARLNRPESFVVVAWSEVTSSTRDFAAQVVLHYHDNATLT